MLEWWRVRRQEIGELEQLQINLPLREWVLGVRDCETLKSSNWTVIILSKFWIRLYKKVTLGLSPLVSFVWHLAFREGMENDDFTDWQGADMAQFCKLGEGRVMLPLEHINRGSPFNISNFKD